MAGSPRSDRRDHLEIQARSQWIHLPEKDGNWRGVCNRLRIWALDSTWERVFTALLAQAGAEGDPDWFVSVNSTIVRAHQNAAWACPKGIRPTSPTIMRSGAPAVA
ncbi:hypothetical protein [Streptomyces sp. NPDC057966]|uniref:hypothetical protein n=1 Tax=Streptomyces sp. NPDC057966 TaxID=3346292 RepID=UPI0036EC8B7E